MRFMRIVTSLALMFCITIASSIGTVASASGDEKAKSVYSGSGFFIAPDIVVTSNHVVKDSFKVDIVYNNAIKAKGVVIGCDEDYDLALLRVSGLENLVSPLVLGKSGNVRQGSRVYALGFPLPGILGTQPKLTEGIVSCTTGLQGDPRMYQISNPIQPGNSGGPLLNDRAEVVGVITGSINYANMMKLGIFTQNINYAVKINNLNGLLSDCILPITLREPAAEKSLSPEDIADIAGRALAFVIVTK